MKAILLAALLTLAIPAFAAPTITVNGSSGTVTVYAGSMMSIAVTSGPANPKDWVGVYSGGNVVNWRYLSTDTTVIPTAGMTNGMVHIPAPAMVGSYEVQFLANPRNAVVATASINVALPTAVWTGQGATWLPGLDLTDVPFFTFAQAATLRVVTCRVEVPVGAPATFWVVKASDGQKIADGTQVSTPCDGNTALLTKKQDLTPANPIAVNPGETLGFFTSDGAIWKAGNGTGSVSVGYTVP